MNLFFLDPDPTIEENEVDDMYQELAVVFRVPQ